MPSPRLRRALTLVGASLLVLVLGGCAGAPWGSLLPLAMWALSVALVGCAASHEAGTPCCEESRADGWGRVSTCHCPAGWACNYAPFADCGGGVCRIGSRSEPGICDDRPLRDAGPRDAPDATLPPDAPIVVGSPDAPGFYEPCCETGPDGIGHVSTCFCPAGWACNYGWFTRCGGDTCAFSTCPDAGLEDAAADIDSGTGAEG
jgi:hypothetical protein